MPSVDRSQKPLSACAIEQHALFRAGRLRRLDAGEEFSLPGSPAAAVVAHAVGRSRIRLSPRIMWVSLTIRTSPVD